MSESTMTKPCNDTLDGHFCASPEGHDGPHQSCGGWRWSDHNVHVWRPWDCAGCGRHVEDYRSLAFDAEGRPYCPDCV